MSSDALKSQSIEGLLTQIVYCNADNGWTVARLQPGSEVAAAPSPDDSIIIVGNLAHIHPGEILRVSGRWVSDRRYGRQFRVSHFTTLQPATTQGIRRYLGSGLVAGVGPKLAKRLVDRFGDQTLRIIEEEPGRLRSIPGLGKKKVHAIRAAWKEQRAVKDVMLFLQTHNVGSSYATQIFKLYGSDTIDKITENPYRLARDIVGIGFLRADEIAQSMGIPLESPQRIRAALLYDLTRAGNEGHCYLPVDECHNRTAKLVKLANYSTSVDWPELMNSLQESGAIQLDDDRIYLRGVFRREERAAKRLAHLMNHPPSVRLRNTAASIGDYQVRHKIDLDPIQRTAMLEALNQKVVVITGGPGTGKTTLVRGIVDLLKKQRKKIVLCAPTGRAAKRLSLATQHDAATLHRVLEWQGHSRKFAHDAQNPIEADFIIVDESSMLDLYLFQSLIEAVPDDAQITFIGDIDQLPSVGAGAVLQDLIEAGIPTVRLEKIFRQSDHSHIVKAAHKIREGQSPRFPPSGETADFLLIERADPNALLDTLKILVTQRLPQSLHVDAKSGIQVLSPMKGGPLGTESINKCLQDALNPDGATLWNSGLKVGDKVMQTRNNYNLEVYNGDIGFVESADKTEKTIDVRFDDHEIRYQLSELGELSLAYACTIHKSQGSEYPVLIVIMHSGHYVMLQRNLLYTAITRAKRQAIVLGEMRAFNTALRNAKKMTRYTRLAERLKSRIEMPEEP